MRVRLIPAVQHKEACALYRLEEPARTAGVEAQVSREPLGTYETPQEREVVCCRQEFEGEDRVVELQEDVVVFGRPYAFDVPKIIPLLQARGVAVVIDLDDDLGRLVPKHPAFEFFAARNSNTQRACQLADLVTCTTQALADRYAPHGRYRVLPNCVPERLLDYPRASDGKTLGWTGYQEMHPGDLEVVHGGVQEALDRAGWHFRTIGPPEGVGAALGLRHFEATGHLEDIGDYYLMLGTLDVGIVPLADNKFNASKSYLKGLEYLARGVAYVASPTEPYAQFDEGLLALARGRTWRAQLLKLMENESLRQEIVEMGQEAIRLCHTYERQGYLWAEAWEDAMDNRVAAEEKEVVAV